MASALEQLQQRREQLQSQLTSMPNVSSQQFLRNQLDRNKQPAGALQSLQSRQLTTKRVQDIQSEIQDIQNQEQQLQQEQSSQTDTRSEINERIKNYQRRLNAKDPEVVQKATARIKLLQEVKNLPAETQQYLLDSGELTKLESKAIKVDKLNELLSKQVKLSGEPFTPVQRGFSAVPFTPNQQRQDFIPLQIDISSEVDRLKDLGYSERKATELALQGSSQSQSLNIPNPTYTQKVGAGFEKAYQKYYYEPLSKDTGQTIQVRSPGILSPLPLALENKSLQKLKDINIIKSNPIITPRSTKSIIDKASDKDLNNLLYGRNIYKVKTSDIAPTLGYTIPYYGTAAYLTEYGGKAFEDITKLSDVPTFVSKYPLETAATIGLVTTPLIVKGLEATPLKIRNLELGASNTKILGFETKTGRALSLGTMSITSQEPKILKVEDVFRGNERNLIGPSKKIKLGVGTPNLAKELVEIPVGTEIKVGSALETKALKNTIKNVPEEKIFDNKRFKEALGIQQKILRKTVKTKSKFITEFPKTTERLPEIGVKELLNLGSEEQGVLFGSFSRSGQLAKEYTIGGNAYKLNKVPRDIEFRFDNAGEKELQRITDLAEQRLKNVGIKARQIKDTPFAIEAKQPSGEFAKVAEFKGKENLIEGEDVPEFVLGLKKVGKPTLINNIVSTPLSEELRGVMQGVARIRKTKEGLLDIIPSPKRMKDIGSVVVSSRTLQQSKRILGFKYDKSLLKDIEKFESLYPQELVLEQLKPDDSFKKLIGDFRVSTTSSTINPKLDKNIPLLINQNYINRMENNQLKESDQYYNKLIKKSDEYYNYLNKYNQGSLSNSISKSSNKSPYLIKSLTVGYSPKQTSNTSSIVPPYKTPPSISTPPSSSTSVSPRYTSPPSIIPPYKSPPYNPPSTSPPYTPPNKSLQSNALGLSPKKARKLSQAYRLFVKQRGKYNPMGVYTKGKALLEGEKITRGTLAASFKIEPINRYLDVPDIDFKPSNIFRTYKIRRGKRISLQNEFIQRRGTRLSSRSEVKEILGFKRAKQRKGRRLII